MKTLWLLILIPSVCLGQVRPWSLGWNENAAFALSGATAAPVDWSTAKHTVQTNGLITFSRDSFRPTIGIVNDGTSYLRVTDSTSLRILGDITIVAWVRGNGSEGSGGERFHVIANGSWYCTNSAYTVYQFDSVTPADRQVYFDWRGSVTTNWESGSGGWEWDLDLDLHQYALVRSNNYSLVYIDGFLKSASVISFDAPTDGGYDTYIGIYAAQCLSNENPYFGIVGPVAIWTKVLTPKEIAILYEQGRVQ